MSSQPIFDKSLELRAPGTVTATETCTALTIMPGKINAARAVINVQAVDRTSGDETYVFALEASNDGGSTFMQVSELVSIVAAGRYELAFTGLGVEAVCPGATQLHLKTTIAGTTPSLTYDAFLTKI